MNLYFIKIIINITLQYSNFATHNTKIIKNGFDGNDG
jgi:hypothetical protein